MLAGNIDCEASVWSKSAEGTRAGHAGGDQTRDKRSNAQLFHAFSAGDASCIAHARVVFPWLLPLHVRDVWLGFYLQADAALRVAGEGVPDVWSAAAAGNDELVAMHVMADRAVLNALGPPR